jgi:hypothetical protein
MHACARAWQVAGDGHANVSCACRSLMEQLAADVVAVCAHLAATADSTSGVSLLMEVHAGVAELIQGAYAGSAGGCSSARGGCHS